MKLRTHHHLVEDMLCIRFRNPYSKAFECIVIQDGICGIGKTTQALEQIKQILMTDLNNRVMYIGVYLDELHRVAGTKADSKYKDKRPLTKKGKPIYEDKDAEFRQFWHPFNFNGKGKLDHLKELVALNKNVVVTHSLFSSFDKQMIELLQSQNYHLIIDEEPPVIESIDERYSIQYTDENDETHEVEGFTLNQYELCKLEEIGVLSIDKRRGKLSWKGPELMRYKDLYKDVNNNHIDYYYDDEDGSNFFWRYNPEVFKCFKTVQLLTYLFKGSMFQMYLDINKIPYLINDLTEASYYELRKNDSGIVAPVLSPLHQLIHLYTPSKDYITPLYGPRGGDLKPYSTGYFEAFISDKDLRKSSPIKTALGNYFKSVHPVTKKAVPKQQKMWTTLIKAQKALSGNGYKSGFVPFNVRATNKYRNADFLAFVYNPFPRPDVVKYIKNKGGKVQPQAYSTSLLIQWVFRSALRDGKPIKLFIASPRMNALFNDWLKMYKEKYTFCEEVQAGPPQALSNYLVPLKNITTDEMIKTQPGLKHIPKLATLIRGLKGY